MMRGVCTKSRYCYNTAVTGRVGRRVTLIGRFRRWRHMRQIARETDVFPYGGYAAPIYPENK